MDVIIVGAGLAGLVAATTLARAGRTVTVLERAGAPGGRAVTTRVGGARGADYALNLGPHALYTGGATARVLTGLGVPWAGRDPGNAGHVLHGDGIHALPGSPWSFLTTGLFDLRGRVQAAGFVRRLLLDDPTALDRVSVTEWLTPLTDPTTQAWARAMVRVFTYTNDPDRQSAGAVLRQARLAVRSGVTYLDGGWGTLIEGLTTAAVTAGVDIRTGRGVDALDTSGDHPRVQVGAAWLDARAVLIATPLPAARRLLPELPAAPSVRAACLDLALARTEPPALRFVLGIDRPLYFSVHSATARLAPGGGMVAHVAHYLGPDEEADVGELESLADRALPGWRSQVVSRRWMPALTVVSGFAVAGASRPGVSARSGVWVAGDWVGAEGELADTSAASATVAATEILAAGLSGRPARVDDAPLPYRLAR